MPWKNRYIGNPVLTGILNLLFRTRLGDAHCGLRALTRDCFERLRLTGSGMEFASEMVIKAALKRPVIAEVPATLSPDLRDRPPHLRPWRDGWRHLRYLFMLSPTWLFAVPALIAGGIGLAILASATWAVATDRAALFPFGNYWSVLAGAMVSGSHIALVLAFATHLYGVREGYRKPKTRGWSALHDGSTWRPWSPEAACLGWRARRTDAGPARVARTRLRSRRERPARRHRHVAVTLGAQNLLGGFLLAIVGGTRRNSSRWRIGTLKRPSACRGRRSARETRCPVSAQSEMGPRGDAGLRLAIVSSYFDSHRGGVEIVAGRMGRELAARGHEV